MGTKQPAVSGLTRGAGWSWRPLDGGIIVVSIRVTQQTASWRQAERSQPVLRTLDLTSVHICTSGLHLMYSSRSVAFPREPNHRLSPGGPAGPGGPGGPWNARLLYSLTMSYRRPRSAGTSKQSSLCGRCQSLSR